MKLGLILLLTVCAYASVWRNGWVYEDAAMQGVAEGTPGYSEGLLTRNLARGSVYWTAQAFSPSPRVQHAVQLGIHLVNVALVAWLASVLLPTTWGLVATAVFAWHPIQVETAAYVASRPDLLLTTCVLLAVNLAVRPRRWWRWLAIGAVCLLGIAAKQTGVVIAPILLLIVWWQRPAEREGFAWAFVGMLAVGLTLTWRVPHDPDALPYTGMWLASYQSAAFVNLLRLVLVPVGFTIDHNVGIVPPAVALLAVLGLCGVAGWALSRLWAGDRSPVGWLALWPLLLLAPRFLLQTPEFTNEHQLYPAMPAIVLGLTFAMKGIYEVCTREGRAAVRVGGHQPEPRGTGLGRPEPGWWPAA